MPERSRVAVLISGRGSNMAALIYASRAEDCPYEIALVTGDNPAAPGLELAEAEGIRVERLPAPGKNKDQFFNGLHSLLENESVDIVALAGFMRIIPDDFLGKWEGRIVNIHPSLLPKYPGLETHARALAAGDAESGCSVHVVTAEVDAGEVLAQARVPIEAGDTPQTLERRVLAAEHKLYPKALANFIIARASAAR